MDLNNVDFTFMKTGGGNNNFSISDDEKIDIYSLILTFMENAIKSASVYVKHSGRNIIQTMDVKLGLQQEVFMFLKRDNIKTLEKNRKEIVKDYYTMENEEEYTDDEDEDNNIIENEKKEEFKKSTCKCEICENMNIINQNWNNWTPSTKLEEILKKNIDIMIKK